jgi:methionyl-tRNA formyltransferase
MNIIFFGTPKEVVPVLANLNKQYNVVAVVTTPDQKSGRKQQITPSPVKESAQRQNIPVITPQQWNNETIEQLKDFNPDLYIVAAYGKLIPEEILTIPKFGAINIHPSLLPKYRGPTPIQTTLSNGDRSSGVTFIKMDEQMDHGPILHQIPFTLEKTDTFDWLMQSMFAQAAVVLPHVIDEYVSGKNKLQPQDESKATYTKIITKEDGYIDLTKIKDQRSKIKFDRMIRAYFPWPTVWTKIPNVIARKNDEAISSKLEGKIIKFLPSSVIASTTKQSQNAPFAIQVEGKNPVDLNDFFNGYPEMKKTIEKLYL